MIAAVCAAVGVSRATVERRRSRLTAQQRMVLVLLHAPRFARQANRHMDQLATPKPTVLCARLAKVPAA
jgi:hypothetical protein